MSPHNPHKSEAFWREQLAELANYPGSVTEFCRQRRLNVATLYAKKKKFNSTSAPRSKLPVVKRQSLKENSFVPVHIIAHKAQVPIDPKWVAELIKHLWSQG